MKWNTTDTYPTLLSPGAIQDYAVSDAYLQANVPEDKGIFEFRENSLFIYPDITNAVTGGLLAYAIVALKDIASGDAETDLFPNHQELRQYHELLVLGMIPWIRKHKDPKDDTGFANARAEFEA